MLVSPAALGIFDPVKISFALISDTVSSSGTCGGGGLILFMVSAILNSAFLVGYLASNKISVVEGVTLRSAMISFSACFLNSNFTSGKGYSWGMNVSV